MSLPGANVHAGHRHLDSLLGLAPCSDVVLTVAVAVAQFDRWNGFVLFRNLQDNLTDKL